MQGTFGLYVETRADLLYKYRLDMNNFRPSNGFTLLELVLGIPIIAAAAVFAAMAVWNTVFSFRLSAASSNILHDIRLTQEMAMSKNGWYGIEFFADPLNRYHVYSTDGTTDTDVPNPANLAETLNIDFGNRFGVRISTINIDGGSKVEFDPVGRPFVDMNGSALALDGSITLEAGGLTRVIEILKVTGKADIQ